MGGSAWRCENQALGLRSVSGRDYIAVEIKPYTQDFEPLVKAFNRRLRTGGELNWTFPESCIPRYPGLPGKNPYQELFLTATKEYLSLHMFQTLSAHGPKLSQFSISSQLFRAPGRNCAIRMPAQPIPV